MGSYRQLAHMTRSPYEIFSIIFSYFKVEIFVRWLLIGSAVKKRVKIHESTFTDLKLSLLHDYDSGSIIDIDLITIIQK